MDEMETLRIETELERQKSSRGTRGSSENRDSGVADVEVCPCPGMPCSERSDSQDLDQQLKRSALSNSLLDIHEQCEFLLFKIIPFISREYDSRLCFSLLIICSCWRETSEAGKRGFSGQRNVNIVSIGQLNESGLENASWTTFTPGSASSRGCNWRQGNAAGTALFFRRYLRQAREKAVEFTD